MTYFAVDGNYGNDVNIVIVDTRGWTSYDWSAIEDASDGERSRIAADIAARYKALELLGGKK